MRDIKEEVAKLRDEVTAIAAELAALLDRKRREGAQPDAIFAATLMLAAVATTAYKVPDQIAHLGLQAALNDLAEDGSPPPIPFDPGTN